MAMLQTKCMKCGKPLNDNNPEQNSSGICKECWSMNNSNSESNIIKPMHLNPPDYLEKLKLDLSSIKDKSSRCLSMLARQPTVKPKK